MSRPVVTPFQHFFRTSPQPCPYLPGQVERKIITELPAIAPQSSVLGGFSAGPEAEQRSKTLYSDLSRAGFRRSHRYAYRPACPNCSACIPVRIPVANYNMGRSARRLQHINDDLRLESAAAEATLEHYELFSAYMKSRHAESDMVTMSFADYRTMIENSPSETLLVTLSDGTGRIAAICLTDVLDDGLSAVYSFYSTAEARRSLGTFIVLKLIDLCRDWGLPYVYLGYWISACGKMAYKTRFRPLEALGPDGWGPFDSGE